MFDTAHLFHISAKIALIGSAATGAASVNGDSISFSTLKHIDPILRLVSRPKTSIFLFSLDLSLFLAVSASRVSSLESLAHVSF